MNINSRIHVAALLVCALTLRSTTAFGATSALPLDALKAQVCRDAFDNQRSYCRNRIDESDRKLNVAYREAASIAPRNRELRAQQRRWLVEVRDRCMTDACARQAMNARVLELQEIALRAWGRREVPMTGDEQREICAGIADLSSRNEVADRLLPLEDMPPVILPEPVKGIRSELSRSMRGTPRQAFSLPIRRDVNFVFGNYDTGGSCYSSEIRAISEPLHRPTESWPSEEIDDEEEDDVIRWGTWGGGESVLMFHGRYFVVTTRGPEGSVGIVTWITPVGTRRPVCVLEKARTERTVSYFREDAALCSAAVRDELRPLAWTLGDHAEFEFDDVQKEYLQRRGIPGAGMPRLELLESDLDINKDGKPERLARAQYDSGAGCGGAASALYLMSPDGKQLQLGSFNDALAELQTGNTSPVEVHSYRGSTYVRSTLSDKPALFKLSPTSVETECVFHDQPISRVKTLYPLDGPVRDPARRRD